ncbi:MAG: dihydroneopterin aldolase [candidate division KSB1 bacterium]|nr:dihydroneopterin aldolase [candidate division KSB1 bacterium]MDZ7303405.1 dihydroneopterin aldolase [candidate division KSB1 bacterium]MDZ7312277.1 dihydroneopterin aldolase [candidate division KSB1 bacterium]
MAHDSIRLNNMLFRGFHGVWDEEREVGQRFEVDVEFIGDVSAAAKSDSIKDTIDFYQVYQVVEKIITKKSFKLVEALAEAIATALLRKFPAPEVRVCVRKPNSPVPGICDGIEVEIFRQRAMRRKPNKKIDRE